MLNNVYNCAGSAPCDNGSVRRDIARFVASLFFKKKARLPSRFRGFACGTGHV